MEVCWNTEGYLVAPHFRFYTKEGVFSQMAKNMKCEVKNVFTNDDCDSGSFLKWGLIFFAQNQPGG